jgi:hypothetical protein|tara:strand:+ start:891 stop:1301 length:411 start_codon:yes stop_codon:yes gene_type:complete
MGNTLQNDKNWYIYRRHLSTDEWCHTPLHTWSDIPLDEALSLFKHEVFTYALSRHVQYEDCKSIYLYHGFTRVGKASLCPKTTQLEVYSTSIREWLTCKEQLSSTKSPPYLTAFFQKYTSSHTWLNTQTIAFAAKS